MVIIIITFMAGKSVELMLKLQIPMLILASLSILALIVGVFMGELHLPEWTPTCRTASGGFWVIFAVFFPGVTGFLAGIVLSGGLKEPARAIPRCTISSVLTGVSFIYVFLFNHHS